MSYEVKEVRRLSEYAPNIIAVVNAPDLEIPARGYIFKNGEEKFEKVYGSIEKAIEYFISRMSQNVISKDKEWFQIGFLFGNKVSKRSGVPDKDTFVFPFQFTGNDPNKIRSQPYLIKNDVRMGWPMREKITEFSGILNDEQLHFRGELNQKEIQQILRENNLELLLKIKENAINLYRSQFPQLTQFTYID